MLIGQIPFFEFTGKIRCRRPPKQVAKAAGIGLEDRVLGRQVKRPAALLRKVKARLGEASDRVVKIAHTHRDIAVGELEDFMHLRLATLRGEHHCQSAGFRYDEIGRGILVAIGMTADYDGLCPVRYQARHVVINNRFAKDCAADSIASVPFGDRYVRFK